MDPSDKSYNENIETYHEAIKASIELKGLIAKALNIPCGVGVKKIADTINKELKDKIPDRIQRSKEAYKVFQADIEKYRKMI